MLLELLIFAIPVIFSASLHMVVVKFDWFAFLKFPLDHNKTWRGKRIFGKNKTYRGLVVMIFFSIAFTFGNKLLIDYFPKYENYNLLNFEEFSFAFYGFLYGLGYVLAELPNSFIKRQIGTKEGKTKNVFMVIADQLDSVVGIMLLFLPFSELSFLHFGVGVVFFGFIHIAINYLLFLAKIRKEPF